MPSKVSRPQASKMNKKWSPEQVRAMQELRRSGAAGIHKNQGEYRRKPKHVGRGWEDD